MVFQIRQEPLRYPHNINKIIRKREGFIHHQIIIQEIYIKIDIVPDERFGTHKIIKIRNHGRYIRGGFQHFICDPGQRSYKFVDRFGRLYKRMKNFRFGSGAVSDGGYFDNLTKTNVKSGRFNVDHDKVIRE